jgi:hypothetical protein
MRNFSLFVPLRAHPIAYVPVFAKGRFSDKPNAARRSIAKLEPPGGPWWDALAGPAHPIVIRFTGIFEDVVRQAINDPDGSNKSQKFASSLIDARLRKIIVARHANGRLSELLSAVRLAPEPSSELSSSSPAVLPVGPTSTPRCANYIALVLR